MTEQAARPLRNLQMSRIVIDEIPPLTSVHPRPFPLIRLMSQISRFCKISPTSNWWRAPEEAIKRARVKELLEIIHQPSFIGSWKRTWCFERNWRRRKLRWQKFGRIGRGLEWGHFYNRKVVVVRHRATFSVHFWPIFSTICLLACFMGAPKQRRLSFTLLSNSPLFPLSEELPLSHHLCTLC